MSSKQGRPTTNHSMVSDSCFAHARYTVMAAVDRVVLERGTYEYSCGVAADSANDMTSRMPQRRHILTHATIFP